MSARQLDLAQVCPRCGRPVRALSFSAQSVVMAMRVAAAPDAPAGFRRDWMDGLRERAREFEAASPGTAQSIACVLGLCQPRVEAERSLA